MDRRGAFSSLGATFVVALVVALVAACGRGSTSASASTSDRRPSPSTSLPVGLAADSLLAVTSRATTGLALALYRELGREAGNLFFSPCSIASALAMVAEGARGATAGEMGRALHLPDAWRAGAAAAGRKPWRTEGFLAGLSALNSALAPKEADARAALMREIRALRQAHDSADAEARKHQEMRDWEASRRVAEADREIVSRLDAALAEVDQYDLRVASGIWGERSHPFRDDYLRLMGRLAGGAVHAADFVPQFPAERERINAWVAERTENRIHEQQSVVRRRQEGSRISSDAHPTFLYMIPRDYHL